jgi:hypothetical protein
LLLAVAALIVYGAALGISGWSESSSSLLVSRH